MTKRFMLIGGGDLYVPCKPPTTLAIDQEIVQMATPLVKYGERPRVLFIPTASHDDIGYCHGVHVEFELRLGCEYKHLRLEAEDLSHEEVEGRIKWAHIIYVGGGDTVHMMKVWKERGVDLLLIQAASEGKVLCGLSAGAICWCANGLSDQGKKSTDPDFAPCKVDGLNLLPILFSPHWDSQASWRHDAMRELLKTGGIGFALEDNAALQIRGDEWRIISSDSGKKCGYQKKREFGTLDSRQISPDSGSFFLSRLYSF